MNVLIKTMTNLPEHCYDCPCHNQESGYCQADKEHKHSIYRPFWCPLVKINNAYYGRLIRFDDINIVNAPIAPILKGDKVHFEDVAFLNQILEIPPVKAIPIAAVEEMKRKIKEHNEIDETHRQDILKIIDKCCGIITLDTIRDCETCVYSKDGKCAGTEECHDCMFESRYIKLDLDEEKAILKVPTGQDPYTVIGQYIRDHITVIEDIIATIEIDGIRTNELFMVNMQEDGYFVWQSDWYEGEKNIALIDFFPVSEAKSDRENDLYTKSEENERRTEITRREYEDIAKAFQLGLVFGFGTKHDEMDKVINEIEQASELKDKWVLKYEQTYKEKICELNKRKKELENRLNISVQNNIENELNMCCGIKEKEGESEKKKAVQMFEEMIDEGIFTEEGEQE